MLEEAYKQHISSSLSSAMFRNMNDELSLRNKCQRPSGYLGISTSRPLDLSASRHLDISTSRHLGISTSRHLDISTSRHLDISTSKSRQLHISTFQLLNIWTFRHLDKSISCMSLMGLRNSHFNLACNVLSVISTS